MPSFDEAERLAVIRQTESGTPIPCLSGASVIVVMRRGFPPSRRRSDEISAGEEDAR